jgi:hypothetical protein
MEKEPQSAKDPHGDPKFWALVVALWVLLFLALVNIVEKIEMLTHLTSSG